MNVTKKVQMRNGEIVLFHPETSVDMIIGLKNIIDDLQVKIEKQKAEIAELTDQYPSEMFYDKIKKQYNMKIISSTLIREDTLYIKENTFYNITEVK